MIVNMARPFCLETLSSIATCCTMLDEPAYRNLKLRAASDASGTLSPPVRLQ